MLSELVNNAVGSENSKKNSEMLRVCVGLKLGSNKFFNVGKRTVAIRKLDFSARESDKQRVENTVLALGHAPGR